MERISGLKRAAAGNSRKPNAATAISAQSSTPPEALRPCLRATATRSKADRRRLSKAGSGSWVVARVSVLGDVGEADISVVCFSQGGGKMAGVRLAVQRNHVVDSIAERDCFAPPPALGRRKSRLRPCFHPEATAHRLRTGGS